jgi:hypothetical protein
VTDGQQKRVESAIGNLDGATLNRVTGPSIATIVTPIVK